MTLDEAKAAIERVVASHPELTDFGFGVFDARRKTPEQCAAEFATNRALMFEPRSLDEFVAACGWLTRHNKIKSLNRKAPLQQHDPVRNAHFMKGRDINGNTRANRRTPASP
jgi:hypothetical protein